MPDSPLGQSEASVLTDQELADLSQGLILLHNAKLYGFIKGGPKIDAEHCEVVLARPAREGIVPDEDGAQRAALAFFAQFNAEKEASNG